MANITFEIIALRKELNNLSTFTDEVASGADEMWLLLTGTFVFMMQAGFAMLEAGSVSAKNTINILFKNLMDAVISIIVFWLVGFGFAYGTSAGGFIGSSNFALTADEFSNPREPKEFALFFFQWVFTATPATIVSGSVN